MDGYGGFLSHGATPKSSSRHERSSLKHVILVGGLEQPGAQNLPDQRWAGLTNFELFCFTSFCHGFGMGQTCRCHEPLHS